MSQTVKVTLRELSKSVDKRNKRLGAQWRLLWCFEECFRASWEEARENLGNLASEHKGVLTCLKSAPRLEEFFAARGNGCAIYSVVLVDETGFQGFMEVLERQPAIHWPTAIVVCRNKPAGPESSDVEAAPLKSSRLLRGVPVMLCSSFSCGGMALRDAIKMVVRLSDGYSEPRVSRVDSCPPSSERTAATDATSSGSHSYALTPNHIPIKHRRRRSSRERTRPRPSASEVSQPFSPPDRQPDPRGLDDKVTDKAVPSAPLPMAPAAPVAAPALAGSSSTLQELEQELEQQLEQQPLQQQQEQLQKHLQDQLREQPRQQQDQEQEQKDSGMSLLSPEPIVCSSSHSSSSASGTTAPQQHATPASPRTIPLPSRLTKSSSWESSSSKSTTTSVPEAPQPDRLPKPAVLSF